MKRIAWHKSPIDRETLRQLNERSDAAGLKQAGGFLLIYIVNTALAVTLFKQQFWIPMAIVCYLHSAFVGFMGMGAAVHELSHTTPFKTKWLNEVFYYLFSFLTWNNPIHFRYSHRKHHHYTVHRGSDKEIVLEPIALSPWTFLSWLTFNYQWFIKIMKPNLAHFFGRGEVDFFFWDPMFEEGDEHRKQMIAWARFLVLGHVALLALFIYFRLWVLIYTVTFSYFFAGFFCSGCGSLQHLGLRSDVPDWRLSCHTVNMNPLLRFLYWQMNYHIEHHMYASVPFFNLPKLRAAIEKDLPEPMANSFFGGLRNLLRIQKQQKQDPSYCHTPVFPDTAQPPKYSETTAV